MKAGSKLVCASILTSLLGGGASLAAEDGKSVYLLGAAASMAGATPPPGFYFTSLTYYYGASATGGAAISRTLNGRDFPGFGVLQTNAKLKVKAQVGINVFSLMWVAPEKVLGGNFGVGVLAPVGYQSVDVDMTARTTLTFPSGNTLLAGRTLRVSDSTFAFGDPLATAFIGWNAGNMHWKLTGLVNIPVGSYSKSSLVNMGFNHWAADITGSITYLDPKSGFEASGAMGFTFNSENPATRYKTGTEFHFEGALMQHFSKAFAVGIAGYHYQQISGDSGAGAVLGPFKGRVSALGPNLTYNFMVDGVPVLTSLKFMREFNVEKRLTGNVGMFTLTVPLGGGAKGHGPG